MFGIIIITHGDLGTALLDTTRHITGDRLEGVAVVSITPGCHSDQIRRQISNSIKSVQRGSGVLILTDMFGGTPSNLSYAFLDDGNVEVISGINLPMLIKALDIRRKQDLATAAPAIEIQGKKSISLASGILKTGKGKKG